MPSSNRPHVRSFLPLLAAAAPLACGALANGQTYTEVLQEGSTYRREDCLGPCDCVALNPPGSPMSGTFTLVFDHQDQWTRYYTVTGASFTTSTILEPNLHMQGTGAYHIGGDFALTHRLELDLVVIGGTDVFHYDSGEVVITGSGHANFPDISITATTGVTGCERRTLVINAAADEAPPCAADVGGAGGLPGADGELDNNDFIVFINQFFDSDPSADRGSAGGEPGSDGQFDNNDFIVFINQFFDGC